MTLIQAFKIDLLFPIYNRIVAFSSITWILTCISFQHFPEFNLLVDL